MTGGQLIAVDVMGNWRMVPCSYEGIKDGLDDATIDFVSSRGEIGAWIDDEGMLKGLALNVPASFMFGAALYGPVVMSAGQPDDEGDTLPAPDHAVQALASVAEQWAHVVEDAGRKGQSVEIHAEPDTIPPFGVTTFGSEEEFERWLRTRGGE